MSSPTTTQPLNGPGGEGTPQREIASFVAAVRAQLDDLSADEVTELTGGLEADLTDALAAEGDTPAQRYGDPAEYARELRAAAGLPARSGFRPDPETSAEKWRRFLFGPSWRSLPPQAVYREASQALQGQPWWPAVRDFLIVLRPAWWVLRAWLAVQLLMMAAGTGDQLIRGGVAGFLLLIGAVVISVELGRRSPLPQAWQRVLITAGNVLAVIALLPVAAASGAHAYYSSGDSSSPSGLSVDGTPVNNVFPYDSQGRPLTGVQLYDQDGHPLEIGEGARSYSNDVTGAYGDLLPGTGPGTPPRWNVFPMQAKILDDAGNYGPPEQPPAPFSAVPPLIAAPTPTTIATANPTATPTAATSTATPTATPTSTRSPKR
jgi:hypothetical protein